MWLCLCAAWQDSSEEGLFRVPLSCPCAPVPVSLCWWARAQSALHQMTSCCPPAALPPAPPSPLPSGPPIASEQLLGALEVGLELFADGVQAGIWVQAIHEPFRRAVCTRARSLCITPHGVARGARRVSAGTAGHWGPLQSPAAHDGGLPRGGRGPMCRRCWGERGRGFNMVKNSGTLVNCRY